NLAAEQRVDRAVEPFDRLSMRDAIGLPLHDGDGSGLATLPQQVLDISLKLTGSSVGNVYLDKRNAPELGLAAASQNVNPLETIAISDEHSVVAWVYRRRRPMVINDIRDFQRMNPTGRYRSVTGPTTAAYAELAVPVFQSSIGQSVRNVIGVINVEKVRRSDGSGDSGYFTYRDLTMLRSVATQLSLWQSHALLTTFSRSLAQLTRRNAVQSHGGGRTDSTPPAPTGIPADATGAREVVEETLRSLYNVTRTYSVAVRLISPDQLRLVRFAAYPAERQDDAHPELMVSDRKSVNAWVARMGRACYIRNRKGTKALAPYPGLDGVAECRDGILSELCLPIFVSGRVVGTLNLESRYKDAYADYVELANALVEQVGLAIAHSRRAQEQEVYSLSIATTANLHQVYRHVARLKDYAAGNLELLGIADAIEDAVAAETLANEPPLTTNALIVSVLHQLHFEQLFEVAPAPVVLLHQGTEALILRIVFEELFRNAHAEWLKAGHHCSVQWALNHMGGQDYLGVRVQNPMLRRLHPAATDLYRAPVRYRSGRQHIGAFLSGALVRSLGGELWAASAAPPRFVARVDLPIHAESVGKEEVA
ncbi:MAG TPA: GAF domain-containing protein, partial [Baekduia sp.]|nr:GAF domain-containing protein [Baekduia sp.]